MPKCRGIGECQKYQVGGFPLAHRLLILLAALSLIPFDVGKAMECMGKTPRRSGVLLHAPESLCTVQR